MATIPIRPVTGLAKAIFASGLPRFTELCACGLSVLMTWQARAEARQQLAQLEMRLLDDMGISPEAALAEAAKPFWRD